MRIGEWLNSPSGEMVVTRVITLKPTDSLAHAASEFLRNQISGAPVVEDDGKCVGVLSVTDVIAAAQQVATEHATTIDQFFARSDLVLPASVYEAELTKVRDQLSPAAEQPVRKFMVTDLVTVETSDPIQKVVRSFVDAHVHRILVTDPAGKLRGIISTIDVIAALLRAAT